MAHLDLGLEESSDLGTRRRVECVTEPFHRFEARVVTVDSTIGSDRHSATRE